MKAKLSIIIILISFALVSADVFAQITGPTIICKNGVGVFKTNLNTGGFYTWSGPVNATIIAGQGTNTAVIKFQQSGGKIYVKQGNLKDSLSITLSDLPLPNVSIGSNKALPICVGSEIALTGSGADSLRWLSNVTNGVSFTPGEISFDNFISFNNLNATSLKIADIDGDGWEDIIAGFDHFQSLRIYRNKGLAGQLSENSFDPAVIIQATPVAQRLEIGDFNNDGKPDIAVAFNNNSVSIFKNNCTIGNVQSANFSMVEIVSSSGNFFDIRAIPIADLNNDGKLDIMVNFVSGKLYFFKNNNIGSNISLAGFGQNLFDEKQATYYSTFADIDNDGFKDLCANYYVSFLGVLKNKNPNNGLLVDSNSTANKWVYPVDGYYNLELADFNNDSYLDFAAGTFLYSGNSTYSYKISLFQNRSMTGPISFGPKIDLSLNSRSRGLLTTDLNFDGNKDIIVSTDDLNFKKLSFFKSTGILGDISTSLFSSRQDVNCGFNANAMVEADLNKDGRKDFVAFGNSGIHFFSNKTNHFQLLGIASNGCANIAEINIKPNPTPLALITPMGTQNACISNGVVLKTTKNSRYTYLWQNGNDTLLGKNADSLIVFNSGSYKVIILDSNNCKGVSVPSSVTIAPLITRNEIQASSIVCNGVNPPAIIGLTPDGGGGNFQYAWYSATDTIGVWTKVGTSKDYSPPMVTQDTYFKRGVKGITCTSEVFSNIHNMLLKPMPVAQFEIDKSYQCFPANQFFMEDKTIWPFGSYQREWDFGDGSKDTAALVVKSYAALKNYTITLSINSIHGCKDIESKTVSFPSFNEGQNICLLRVDESSQKNAIVWQRKLGSHIAAYRIYKETNTTNVFEPIGLSPSDSMGYFLDLSSDPIARSNRYKISIVDTCGNEGPLSAPHKTLHLTINKGLNNSYNLIWEPYFGLEPQTINIFRGNTPNNLSLLASLPASVLQFVDQNPLQGNNYYMVELVFGVSCDPTILLKKAFNSSTSNIASSIPSALQDVAGLKSALVNIGPNPFQNEVKVYVPFGQTITLEIFDIQGRKVKKFELMDGGQGINTSDLEEGVYVFSFNDHGRTHQVRMIKNSLF
jgi:hypothetical protein